MSFLRCKVIGRARLRWRDTWARARPAGEWDFAWPCGARRVAKASVSGVDLDEIAFHHSNRGVSAAFSALLIDTAVTPNKISVFHFALGILSCVPLYLTGNFLAAGLMVWVVSILDGVDGEIARAKGLGTKAGEFIDSFLDRLFDTAMIFSIAMATSRMSDSTLPWIFAFVAFAGILLDDYGYELYSNRVSPASVLKAQTEIAKKARFWPAGDVFLFIISITSLLHIPAIRLAIAGSLSVVFSAARLVVVLPASRK